MQTKSRERLRALYAEAPRDEYFEAVRAAIRDYYLEDPSNPYQQSGRSSGAARWLETRQCIAQAVHRDGDFLDVGCANGLLLKSLIAWTAARGFAIRPHGIDFVPELIELARQRLAPYAGTFEVANAFYWTPHRRFDFVRTNLEYVQPGDWPQFLARQYGAVADGGRLIVCHYRNEDDDPVEVASILRGLGYAVVGYADAPGTSVVWCGRPE
jgi:SAM-dependent methyltransferase